MKEHLRIQQGLNNHVSYMLFTFAGQADMKNVFEVTSTITCCINLTI